MTGKTDMENLMNITDIFPKGHWLTPEEEEAIVRYYVEHYNELDGYRRMCYKMIDEDVVYAIPSSV